MPSKPTDIDAVTVTLDKNGTASLSGINYDDLRSILTAASLHCYNDKVRIEPLDGHLDDVVHANNLDNRAWHLHRHLMVNVLVGRLEDAIRPGYGDGAQAIESAKFLYQSQLDRLEPDVRKAEQEAAKAKADVDPLQEKVEEMEKALQQVSATLAGVKQASKTRRPL